MCDKIAKNTVQSFLYNPNHHSDLEQAKGSFTQVLFFLLWS